MDIDNTGPITHAEARQMLTRFNASHWNNGQEKARYTIPADPRRDDDIRMHAYVDQMEALATDHAALLDRAEAAENRVNLLEEALARARVWGIRGKGYEARASMDLGDWVDRGMIGDLPCLDEDLAQEVNRYRAPFVT